MSTPDATVITRGNCVNAGMPALSGAARAPCSAKKRAMRSIDAPPCVEWLSRTNALPSRHSVASRRTGTVGFLKETE
ncbi:hypothetical protein GCM10010985_26350 [Caballeronia grimmiae]|uniref:Uncharacterized protein n=1 Tax=Caballeronia grimmiae TaxID=1071679 RepID=A0ABQ1RHH3_9BURK|nr:hypothetical protein GCM10010985_26350 [Caballeronia grimmiae]